MSLCEKIGEICVGVIGHGRPHSQKSELKKGRVVVKWWRVVCFTAFRKDDEMETEQAKAKGGGRWIYSLCGVCVCAWVCECECVLWVYRVWGQQWHRGVVSIGFVTGDPVQKNRWDWRCAWLSGMSVCDSPCGENKQENVQKFWFFIFAENISWDTLRTQSEHSATCLGCREIKLF